MSDIARYNDARIKRVLMLDKRASPKGVVRVMKSEIMSIINNYLVVDKDNVYMDIILNSEGMYELRLRAISKKIKMVHSFTE